MTLLSIFSFLGAGVAIFAYWSAGVARSYDTSDPHWPGLRYSDQLRARHGDEKAKSLAIARAMMLFWFSAIFALVTAAIAVWQIYWQAN